MSHTRFSSIVRIAGVLILGTFGLHQLSYLLQHGDGTGAALAAEGHGYLIALGPGLVVIALALVAASVAVRLLGGHNGCDPRSREANAAVLAVAFLALFLAQELLEGVLAAGHPDGLDAVAHSWIALPLALPIGALAALGLAGLQRTEQLLAAAVRAPGWALARAPRRDGVRAEQRRSLVSLPLAFGLARRGPPAAAGA